MLTAKVLKGTDFFELEIIIEIMNSNTILEFLKIYKKLDELCRQILSSDRGVSEYIDEMSNESQGYRIAGWENDYKKLKKMRWIRNRLVHETDSFEDDIVNVEDIQWLHIFYCRIMECTDPFSLLHQSENIERKTDKRKKGSEINLSRNKPSFAQNKNLLDKDMILAGIILAGIILIGIVILVLFFCFNRGFRIHI